ncbi:MAG: hypothetical protein ISR69_13660 [Gammaproteobacteria bacterium]|nr:hypothetical protein [Gammaproteobacteria bacterium]
MKSIDKILIVFSLVVLIAANNALAALPKSVLKDKYTLALVGSLKNQNYLQAIEYINKLEKLDVPMADSFYYYKGEACLKIRDPACSISALELYINKAGKMGKYYQSSLVMLVEAENKLVVAKAKQEKQNKQNCMESCKDQILQCEEVMTAVGRCSGDHSEYKACMKKSGTYKFIYGCSSETMGFWKCLNNIDLATRDDREKYFGVGGYGKNYEYALFRGGDPVIKNDVRDCVKGDCSKLVSGCSTNKSYQDCVVSCK